MKKITRKLMALLVISLFTSAIVFSQSNDYRWAIGIHANVTNYQGDLGNEFLDFGDIGDIGGGLSIDYYLSPTFDIGVRAAYHNVSYEDETGTYAKGAKGYADLIGTQHGNWKFSGDMFSGMANLIFKFNNGWMINEDSWFKPYLIGGIGSTYISSDITRDVKSSKDYNNLDLYYGAGIKFGVSERFNLVLEAGVHNPMTDVYDGIDDVTAHGWKGAGDSDDIFLQYSVGLTYALGKPKDGDADGIKDKKDQCPNTPIGVAVDENGCPLDKDQDGIPDYKDECPDVKGTVKGCPDKDKDSIIDKNDACPDVAGPKSLNGCPDSDADGVIDKNDKCPNTPRKAKVDATGCPIDTDGDGLFDYQDKCPNKKGPKSNNGCPIAKKHIEAVKQVAENILFNTNSDKLKTSSYSVLDQAVTIMKENPAYRLSIDGHTDSTGKASYNLNLSNRRANSVRDYIISKGISANRIRATGYGEDKPIDTNATKKGRENNRRVELHLSLK